jgi:hypothetical protein
MAAPRVKVALGVTLQLRQFESIRVDVGYEEDVRADEKVSKTYERAWKLIERELNEATVELKENITELKKEL